MRKLIILSLIVISIMLIFGCSNHAFKVVATTVNPTPKQKGLLAIACNNQFKQTPQFTKGELRIDTLTINSSDTVIINKFDTVQVTITNTVKAIVTQFRTDTIKEGNPYKEYLLESQLRDKDYVISNIENENKQKGEKIKDQRSKLVIAMIGYGLQLLALIIFVVIKIRGRIL